MSKKNFFSSSLWASQNGQSITNFTIEEAKFFLLEANPTLLSGPGFVQFATYLNSQNFAEIQSIWNLTSPQALSLYNYFFSSARAVVTGYLDYNQVGGSGLIAANTVDSWLWRYSDPLLSLIVPGLNTGHFFDNETEEDARMFEPDQYYTGRGEIKNIGKYIKYHGTDVIREWAEEVPVQGTDGLQFKPSVSSKNTLYGFVGEILRPVPLTHVSNEKFRDISLKRFQIEPTALEPNPIFYQTTTGLANITQLRGAPVFVSKNGFLDVPATVRERIDIREPDLSLDQTFVDIEPITGIAMRAHKRLQVNLYVAPSELYSEYYPDLYTDSYNPIVMTDETSEIDEENAKRFRDKVYRPLAQIFVSFVTLLVFGTIFVCCGVGLAGFGAYQLRSSRASYSPL